MIWREKPYIIDWSTALEKSHPKAIELLKRDLKTITKYFKKQGMKTEKYLKEIELSKILGL